MYNIIAESNEATVVAEYTPLYGRKQEYQSEAVREAKFVDMLQQEGYEHLRINSEAELIANLRKKLEELNNYEFTDNEWNTFLAKALLPIMMEL